MTQGSRITIRKRHVRFRRRSGETGIRTVYDLIVAVGKDKTHAKILRAKVQQFLAAQPSEEPHA